MTAARVPRRVGVSELPSLNTADKLASISTFVVLVLGAVFYSGVLFPIRLSQALAKVVPHPSDNTKAWLLFEIHIFNRTRYGQTLREVIVFARPPLRTRWWRPVLWRRRSHEFTDLALTDDRDSERVRLGDRGDGTSRTLADRNSMIVRVIYRLQPSGSATWTDDLLEQRHLYVAASFDGRRSAAGRVCVDNAIVNPFSFPAAAPNELDLAAARIAAVELAVAAAAAAASAAAAAAATAAKTAEAAHAALKLLGPPTSPPAT